VKYYGMSLWYWLQFLEAGEVIPFGQTEEISSREQHHIALVIQHCIGTCKLLAPFLPTLRDESRSYKTVTCDTVFVVQPPVCNRASPPQKKTASPLRGRPDKVSW
jgi:hypothetical protein